MENKKISWRPVLNAYPDSLGGSLGDIVQWLKDDAVKGAFSGFYILPSLYHSDLDRGFSVIDYQLDPRMASEEDFSELCRMGIVMKLDFVMNHGSVLSPQFQDILKNGQNSRYKDFFINWNRFWEGRGTMTKEGYILPDEDMLRPMFFRKPGLPFLMVDMPDGEKVPYWNTFYQEVRELEGKPYRQYLGQMDFNISSPLVWEFYKDTLDRLKSYGAGIVRLDAFAYAAKAPGRKNFFNVPETWELLERLKRLGDERGLSFLPEIHSAYDEKIYKEIAQKGYMTYDFFLPGLIIDALDRGDGTALVRWIRELIQEKISAVNMLGCHDGIPFLDLKGLLLEERIQELINLIVSRGGYVKNLHGEKNMYYQVNAAYFSALGEDERALLLARGIQLFTPGLPQIWYLDLFAGKNDKEAVRRAGVGGHKEINRTNLSWDQIAERMKRPVVSRQLELLKFRNAFPAFEPGADICAENDGAVLRIRWTYGGCRAEMDADLKSFDFAIRGWTDGEKPAFSMEQ